MSDLQCPATVFLLSPEVVAHSDMPEQRLSLVIFARDIPSHSAALSFGARHGCETRAADIGHGSLSGQIAELADMYRGEQVAIIARAEIICQALRLSTPPTAAVALAVDSDGWRILYPCA